MRKLVSLGLLALTFSLLSSQLLASKAEVCDQLKGEANRLHGLCVAWHNADDKHQGKIAARFEELAGYPLEKIFEPDSAPQPAPDFFCPCWTEVTFNNICSLGEFSGAFILGSINIVIWEDLDNGVDETLSADATGCGYSGDFAPDALMSVPDDLSSDEALDCVAEIEMISAMHIGGFCD